MFLKLRSRWRAGGGKRSIGCDNMKGRSKKKGGAKAQKKYVSSASQKQLMKIFGAEVIGGNSD